MAIDDVPLSEAFAESAQSQGRPRDLPQYQSALLLTPLSSKDEDAFTDIRLSDPVYSARTEGEPNSFSFRTFLQVKPMLMQPHTRSLTDMPNTLPIGDCCFHSCLLSRSI